MALKLRKNDNVMIIAGKERGTTGKILKVLSEKDRAIIERLNLVKRHTKPRGPQQPGGILEKEVFPCPEPLPRPTRFRFFWVSETPVKLLRSIGILSLTQL